MKRTTFAIWACIPALLLGTACQRNLTIKEPNRAIVPQDIVIKSIISTNVRSAVNGVQFPSGYDMLVSAYHNTGANAGEDSPGNYFKGIAFSKGDDGLWRSATGPKYWPLDGTLDFLAVASAGLKDETNGIAPVTASWETDNVASGVDLDFPDNGGKFDDLMYSSLLAQMPVPATTGVPMVFKHADAAVVFTAKANIAYDAARNVGITIDGITVDNAKFGGRLRLSNPSAGGGSGDMTASWTSLSEERNHTAARVWDASNLGTNASEPALSGLHLGKSSTSISSRPFGEGYVILPEQPATTFTVSYTIHNGKDALGADLDNQLQYRYECSGTWFMGKKYIYELTFLLNEITVTPMVVDWNNEAGMTIPIPGQQDNEIWYTSTDENIITPKRTDVFGANIISNTYENGKGIIKFDGPVTSIGEGAFFCTALTSIEIPSSVTSIGEWVFESCSSLTSIEIPSSVTSIGESAFCECESLTSITIPSSVTSIEDMTFSDCHSLTSVEIPSSVTIIHAYAFKNCTGLTSVIIPSSMTSIGGGAFWDCTALTSITIPSSMTSIGTNAFSGCTLPISCFANVSSLDGYPWGATLN